MVIEAQGLPNLVHELVHALFLGRLDDDHGFDYGLIPLDLALADHRRHLWEELACCVVSVAYGCDSHATPRQRLDWFIEQFEIQGVFHGLEHDLPGFRARIDGAIASPPLRDELELAHDCIIAQRGDENATRLKLLKQRGRNLSQRAVDDDAIVRRVIRPALETIRGMRALVPLRRLGTDLEQDKIVPYERMREELLRHVEPLRESPAVNSAQVFGSTIRRCSYWRAFPCADKVLYGLVGSGVAGGDLQSMLAGAVARCQLREEMYSKKESALTAGIQFDW